MISVEVVQPDGKILIGGGFTTLSPNGGVSVTRNHLARLNPDGTLDAAFNPNANDSVLSIVVQADGKVLVGGGFTTVGGQTRNRIARLDATTGAADSFNPNANDAVFSIAVQPDGKILVCGLFVSVGGQMRDSIARLDPTTGLADSFDPNKNNIVKELVVQADGKILVAGQFTSVGGQVRNHIARLHPNGTLDMAFNPNADDQVGPMAVQADGKIVVGGNFNSIGGQTRNYIARLDPTTGAPDSFNPNANDVVRSIAVQPDGKILVGGFFNQSLGAITIGGQTRNYIARLDPVTGIADSFGTDFPFHLFAFGIFSVAVQQDGKVLAGGDFSEEHNFGNETRNYLARLEIDGRLDRTLNLSFDGDFPTVGGIALQPDGKILIGGHFDNISGVSRNNIARLNTDGTLDAAFDPNINGAGADIIVTSIAVQIDGKILVGGVFNSVGGQLRNTIARLNPDGTLDAAFNPHAAGTVSERLLSIVVQADAKILVGGQAFSNMGGQPRIGIARLNAMTGLADSFNPNPDNPDGNGGNVASIGVQTDGKILVGGAFTSIGGQNRTSFARLDATTGLADSFNPGGFVSGDQGGGMSIVVQNDGKIIVGGDFFGANSIGGQTRNFIARLNPTGSADSFNPNANEAVVSIVVQADSKILVGGAFTSIGGQTRNYVARLDGTTGQADSFDPNADNTTGSLAVQADGKILAGIDLTSVSEQERHGLARLTNDTAALQDLSVTQNAVTWTRGGSSVQFARVTFESSNDNLNYTPLGSGTATGNSWTLTGLSFSTGMNFYVRARGYYRSGPFNGSESITESVRNVFIAGPTPTPGPTATPGLSPTPTPTPTASPTATPGTITPPGNNVVVQSPSGDENVTFAQVATGGITTFVSIDPASAGQLPPGYQLSGESRAFDITTTATIIPPIDVSFHFPSIINPAIFASLRILHGESGTLVDRTVQHDFATKMIRARVNSLSPFVVAQSTTAPNRLLNISTRLRVETGDNVLIGGFIITGNDPKRVIIRGIGQSLSVFGVPDALQNPTLQLYQGGTLLAENDNWKDTQQVEIEGTGIPPSNDLESAIMRTLSPGAYTAILRGKDNGAGIGLVEAYDLSTGADAKLANISTRGFVATGDNVLIGGFIVGSTSGTPAAVVVRAIGPSLSGLGVPGALQNPTLDLHNSSGVIVASNDNWREAQQAEISASGIAPSDDRESAIVATLAPGAYTAIVSGTGNTTGVAVVEVYNVQ